LQVFALRGDFVRGGEELAQRGADLRVAVGIGRTERLGGREIVLRRYVAVG